MRHTEVLTLWRAARRDRRRGVMAGDRAGIRRVYFSMRREVDGSERGGGGGCVASRITEARNQ